MKVLVTGAGSGIGREIADALHARGDELVLLARNEQRAADLAGRYAGADVRELAQSLSVEDISQHLYTRGQPDPDLLIRTSGEQRLSGFLMWQSAYSEYYFCEALWPDFRRVDFLRALRAYAARQRRFGS